MRIKNVKTMSVTDVLRAHEIIAKGTEFTDTEIEKALKLYDGDAWPYIVNGVRKEECGDIDQAIDLYRKAAERSVSGDWQAFFRLALVHAERKELPVARIYAEKVIEQSPRFLYREELEKLISYSKV